MNQATEPEGRLVKFLLLALISLICGVVADAVLLVPYMFSSEPWRMWFAAFGIGALFAALAAGWIGSLGSLIASDGTRSRLLLVVGTSEAAAAILAIGGFLLLRSAVFLSSALLPVLSVLFLGLGIAAIALVGSWAALRFRSPRQGLVPDILTTLGLLGLMVAVQVKMIIFAPLL